MNDTLLTFYQALQLAALLPSVFVVCFLLLTLREWRVVVVPSLYFLSLACSFLLPLMPLLGAMETHSSLYAALLLGESLSHSLAFLLIMQFLLGRVPPAGYWLILALPLIGGSPMVYAALYQTPVCIAAERCFEPASAKILYDVVGSAAVFLLLIVNFSRRDTVLQLNDTHRKQKYWVMIALVVMHLALLAIDLLMLAERVTPHNAEIAITITRMGFIYLVLTSIFRVFDSSFVIDLARVPTVAAQQKPIKDESVKLEQVKQLLENDHIYREMGLSREQFARKVGMNESSFSRLINVNFGQSFTGLLNQHRVEDAKRRLAAETTAITVIAFEVGFNSIASFNRVFKELAGCSPSEYRTRHMLP